MKALAKAAARILLVLAVGGFLGATLVRLAPGFGVDEEELDSRLSAESMEAVRTAGAEGQSLPRFYWEYVRRMARGDLGISRTLGAPIGELLAERFPETAKTVALGLAVGWALGLGLAMAATMPRMGSVDLAAGLGANVLLCLPAAVMALLFVVGQIPGRLVVGLIVFPKVFLYGQKLLGQAAEMPHVLTARAKGLGNGRVLLWHILPVAGPQLLALAGVTVSVAFAAAIPVEVLCDLPGIGQLAWKAALGRDMELLVVLTMLVTLITLVANTGAELAVRRNDRGGER